MTVEEVAAYLSLSQDTIYEKVKHREIPFTKVGNLLRFPRPVIDEWLVRNTTQPLPSLYEDFTRMFARWHFQQWLRARGVDDVDKLTEDRLADLARQALEDLREHPPEGAPPPP